jgi:YVTN family beta-propeller protein
VVRANSLVAVDPGNNRVVGTAPLGASPRGVAFKGDRIWTANSGDGTVTEVDARTLRVIRTIGIGAQATDITVAGGALWVATGLDNTLVKLDARSGGTLDTLHLAPGIDASAYAVAHGEGKVWVISGGELFRIDPATDELRGLACCGGSRDVAVGEGSVWVGGILQVVSRISPMTLAATATLSLGSVPTAITVGYGSVWAAGSDFSRLVLWRVDPETLRLTQTITISETHKAANPLGTYGFLATVDVAAGAGAIWATNFDAGTLIRVDPGSGAVTKVIQIGGHPRGLAVSPHRVWVTVN